MLNKFIFDYSDQKLSSFHNQATSYVWSYHLLHDFDAVASNSRPAYWRPPDVGMFKVKFDGGRLGDEASLFAAMWVIYILQVLNKAKCC